MTAHELAEGRDLLNRLKQTDPASVEHDMAALEFCRWCLQHAEDVMAACELIPSTAMRDIERLRAENKRLRQDIREMERDAGDAYREGRFDGANDADMRGTY